MIRERHECVMNPLFDITILSVAIKTIFEKTEGLKRINSICLCLEFNEGEYSMYRFDVVSNRVTTASIYLMTNESPQIRISVSICL